MFVIGMSLLWLILGNVNGTTASIYDPRRLQHKRYAELYGKARSAFGCCRKGHPKKKATENLVTL